MTTAAELKDKITKLELNIARFDSFMNAGDTINVSVDVGTVPSLKKLQATALATILSGTPSLLTSAGNTAYNVRTSGTVESVMIQLLARQATVDSEWNIVAAGSGLGAASLRFVKGVWNTTPLMYLSAFGGLGIGVNPYIDDVCLILNKSMNSPLYFDMQNANVGTSASCLMRLITQNVANSGTVSTDIIKYKTGRFSIHNNETNSAASIVMAIGGVDRTFIDSSGNYGIGATPQARFGVYRDIASEMGIFIHNPNASGYGSIRFGNSDRGTNGDHMIYGGSAFGIRAKTGSVITIEPNGTTAVTFTVAGFFNMGGTAGYPIYVNKTATFADIMMNLNNTGSGISKISLSNTSTTYAAELGAAGNDIFINNAGTEKFRVKTWGIDVQGIVRSGNTGAAYSSTPSGGYGGFIQADSAGTVHIDAYNAAGGSALAFGVNTASGAIQQMLGIDISNFTFTDAKNFVFGTTNGTKIGTATSQKLSLWNATPIIQPTTGISAATFTANSGTAVNDASTFDGYTIKQVVKALRNIGALA